MRSLPVTAPALLALLAAPACDRPPKPSQTLIEAIRSDDQGAIASALYWQDEIDARDEGGRTALYWATWTSRSDLMKKLLDAGAAIDAAGADGRRPLHVAVQTGDPAPVRLLLSRSARVDVRDGRKRQPLHYAALYRNAAAARALLERAADPNARDQEGATPLHWLTSKPPAQTEPDPAAEKAIAGLLTRRGALLQLQADCGWTPQVAAFYRDRLDLARHFGQLGADPDDGDAAPLHDMVIAGDVDKARALLQLGADPDRRAERGLLPLQLAVADGKQALVELLLEHGADPAAKGLLGRTALHEAVARGRTRLVRRLLARGADPRAEDARGRTPVELLPGGPRYGDPVIRSLLAARSTAAGRSR
jgi:ankyrin repeat protein